MKTRFGGKMSLFVVMLTLSVVLVLHGESWAPARCGNGNLDQVWEECEVGHPCVDPAETCDLATCLCSPPPPVCGDGTLDPGEQCEVGVPCAEPGDICDESACLCSPPPGDEGCTPGFWKQDQHFACWAGYTQNQLFDVVFGTDITILWSVTGKPRPVADPTLLQALQANGGGANRLARHGVAALLNASSPGVAFPLSVAEVIAAVQAGDADTLADANELGCPLSQCDLGVASLSVDAPSSTPAAIAGCGTTASVPVGSRAINLTLLGLVFGFVIVRGRFNRS